MLRPLIFKSYKLSKLKAGLADLFLFSVLKENTRIATSEKNRNFFIYDIIIFIPIIF
jgi:hypothetical protein